MKIHPRMKNYTQSRKQLGSMLARKREQKRMTQEEIARILCLHRTAVSKLEHGEYPMILFMIMDYCKALETDLAEVLRDLKTVPEEDGKRAAAGYEAPGLPRIFRRT